MLLTATAAAIATLVPAFLSCAALVGGCWPDVLGDVTPPRGSLPAAGAFPPASAAGLSLEADAFAAAPATVNVHSPPATLARAVTAPTTSILAFGNPPAAVPAVSAASPMTARVLRCVLLIATAMPAPIALLLATPPAQLMTVSRFPA